MKGQILYYLLYVSGDQMTQIHSYKKSSLKLGKVEKHRTYLRNIENRKKLRVSIAEKREVILEILGR